MFADNLILLHWNLRKVGWLEQPEQSSIYCSDADFQTFFEQNNAMPLISMPNAKREKYAKPQLSEATTKLRSVHR